MIYGEAKTPTLSPPRPPILTFPLKGGRNQKEVMAGVVGPGGRSVELGFHPHPAPSPPSGVLRTGSRGEGIFAVPDNPFTRLRICSGNGRHKGVKRVKMGK
jgi:hypothetical protein